MPHYRFATRTTCNVMEVIVDISSLKHGGWSLGVSVPAVPGRPCTACNWGSFGSRRLECCGSSALTYPTQSNQSNQGIPCIQQSTPARLCRRCLGRYRYISFFLPQMLIALRERYRYVQGQLPPARIAGVPATAPVLAAGRAPAVAAVPPVHMCMYGFTVLVPFQSPALSRSGNRAGPGNQGHGVSHPSRCLRCAGVSAAVQ